MDALLKISSVGPLGAMCGILAMLLFNRLVHRRLLSKPLDPALPAAFGAGLQISLAPISIPLLGKWMDAVLFVAGLLICLGVAVVASLLVKKFDWLRREGRARPESRRSRMLDWYQILRAEQSHVVLHMKDGRKILGWPEGWPDHPVEGHFLLTNPRLWNQEKTEELKPSTAAVLLPVADVAWIQFVEIPVVTADAWRRSDQFSIKSMYY